MIFDINNNREITYICCFLIAFVASPRKLLLFLVFGVDGSNIQRSREQKIQRTIPLLDEDLQYIAAAARSH